MLELKAHAKVNLGLNVTRKRQDGFHEVDTLMVKLDLHDAVRLEPQSDSITVDVEGADLPQDRANLAYRAAEAFFQATKIKAGVRIALTKRIPIAAGLAGGSTDAAAVLRGLARLYDTEANLHDLATSLGSDVPFFLLESPAARATGRGETLEPVQLPPLHIVLVNPGIHVSAADAYRQLKTFNEPLALEEIRRRLLAGDEPGYQNALQPGVLELEPEIDRVLDALRSARLRGVLMSGSGSTCFGLARSEEQAADIAAVLREWYSSWWVTATKTLA